MGRLRSLWAGGPDGLPPDYVGMSKGQARQALEVFVEELPASRDRMARMLDGAGADPRLADDLSVEALDPLWEVATSSWGLSWQSDYVPGPTTAHPPVSFPTLEALGPLEELPSWFRHGPTHYLRFSPDSLWVIDVLGRHLGQGLVARNPEVEWVPGPGAPRHHSHEKNRPLVGSTTHWASPLSIVSGLVDRHLSGVAVPGAGLRTSAELQGEAFEKELAGAELAGAELAGAESVGAESVGALEVRTLEETDADDRELLSKGFHYEVWVGDEARLLYDDDAPLALDRALAERPGIRSVSWSEREVLHVKAPGMSKDDVLAAVDEALRDPRVRR